LSGASGVSLPAASSSARVAPNELTEAVAPLSASRVV
jgi:hypothetical protein